MKKYSNLSIAFSHWLIGGFLIGSSITLLLGILTSFLSKNTAIALTLASVSAILGNLVGIYLSSKYIKKYQIEDKDKVVNISTGITAILLASHATYLVFSSQFTSPIDVFSIILAFIVKTGSFYVFSRMFVENNISPVTTQ